MRADDGIRTRDPHLGKVMPYFARARCNRWSRGQRRAFTAADRWNRSNPLQWSSRATACCAGESLSGVCLPSYSERVAGASSMVEALTQADTDPALRSVRTSIVATLRVRVGGAPPDDPEHFLESLARSYRARFTNG